MPFLQIRTFTNLSFSTPCSNVLDSCNKSNSSWISENCPWCHCYCSGGGSCTFSCVVFNTTGSEWCLYGPPVLILPQISFLLSVLKSAFVNVFCMTLFFDYLSNCSCSKFISLLCRKLSLHLNQYPLLISGWDSCLASNLQRCCCTA